MIIIIIMNFIAIFIVAAMIIINIGNDKVGINTTINTVDEVAIMLISVYCKVILPYEHSFLQTQTQ